MKEKTTVIKRRKYDASFKEEVLKMVFNGRPVGEVAQSLGIGDNLIYPWKSHYQKQPFSRCTPKCRYCHHRRTAGFAQTH